MTSAVKRPDIAVVEVATKTEGFLLTYRLDSPILLMVKENTAVEVETGFEPLLTGLEIAFKLVSVGVGAIEELEEEDGADTFTVILVSAV